MKNQTMIAPIISTEKEVDIELKKIDPALSISFLHEIAQGGLARMRETHAGDADNAEGVFLFHGILGTLRIELMAKRWQKVNIQNASFVRTENYKHMIGIISGDKDTGLEKGLPKNQNEKGKITKEFVQGKLFSEDENITLWFMLYHLDLAHAELRMELSQPQEFEGKYVVSWKKRILIPPVSLHPTAGDEVDNNRKTDNKLDIPVERKNKTN